MKEPWACFERLPKQKEQKEDEQQQQQDE